MPRSDGAHRLYAYFESRLAALRREVAGASGLGERPRVTVRWEEVMKPEVRRLVLDREKDATIVHFWRRKGSIAKPGRDLHAAVAGGYRAIASCEQYWHVCCPPALRA